MWQWCEAPPTLSPSITCQLFTCLISPCPGFLTSHVFPCWSNRFPSSHKWRTLNIKHIFCGLLKNYHRFSVQPCFSVIQINMFDCVTAAAALLWWWSLVFKLHTSPLPCQPSLTAVAMETSISNCDSPIPSAQYTHTHTQFTPVYTFPGSISEVNPGFTQVSLDKLNQPAPEFFRTIESKSKRNAQTVLPCRLRQPLIFGEMCLIKLNCVNLGILEPSSDKHTPDTALFLWSKY